MVRTLLAALALAMAPPPAAAQPAGHQNPTGISGTVFMRVCASPLWRPGHLDACGALIMGVIDGLIWGGQICPTRRASSEQLQQLSYDAVRQQPEAWDASAARLIRARIASLYPCKT